MNANTLTTGEVRLSYVHLLEPYANNQDATPKYSATILVQKTDATTVSAIKSAIAAATNDGVTSKWKGIKPPKLAVCVHDGDGERPSDGMPFGDECHGCLVFTASCKNKPQIVDTAIQPVIDQASVYSGVYGRVNISFFPYDSNGKKGIGCGLNCVQITRDGEALGGGVSASEAFGGANAKANIDISAEDDNIFTGIDL